VRLIAVLGIAYLSLLIGWIGYVIFALAGQVADEVEATDDSLRPER
jgi:hypothetical protein